MRRTVILSVNDNPKYFYFLPLTLWCWDKLGWNYIFFYHRKNRKELDRNSKQSLLEGLTDTVIPNCNLRPKFLDWIDDYKSETITQVSRLYGSCVESEGILMTSDIDLLPLSDYWHPEENAITTYGRDLTDYHYPIGYISMPAYIWSRVMNIQDKDYLKHIKRDLRVQKNMWGLDQDLITEKLLAYGKEKITHINRGTDKRTGYPLGRIDRSNWRLDHSTYVDCHLPHDILTNDQSFHKVMEMLHRVFPGEDFKWFVTYTKEFKKLL